MSWLSWLIGRTFSTSSYPLPIGSQNEDGFERNADNPLRSVGNSAGTLRLSAAWGCVRLISQTVSTLPMEVYEYTDKGGKRPARDFWLYDLVHNQPNDESTAQSFWEAYVASALDGGNAWAERRRGSIGQTAALYFLNPAWLSRPERDGSRKYNDPDTGPRTITKDNLMHTLGFTLDGKNGVSPIEYGASVFGSALGADIAANRTFRNGLMPTVGFGMDQVLTAQQRTEFRDNFKREMAGALNAGKPPLLEGGMKAFSLGINPKDAQLLESRAWSIEEICRWYGVPPPMVGHTSKTTSWPTGHEQQNLLFLTYCLRVWLTRIEQSVRKDLLTPAERARYFVKFNVEGLLRADSAGRAAYLATMTQNGLMTRDEGRAYDDREPMGGQAAMLTVQSNMLPIDMLGQQVDPASQAASDAVKAWLGIDSGVKNDQGTQDQASRLQG